MTFLEPSWLLLTVLLIALTIIAIVLRIRQGEPWKLFVSERLASRLVRQDSAIPWWLSYAALILGMICLLFTLAQPTTGKETIKQSTEGRNIFLAVDLSKSMLTRDISPDRLTSAKTAALEIIDQFPSDRIGLISFAGKAWLEAPLTVDHNALRETVLAMNEKNVPLGGSNHAAPLELATAEQKEGELRESVLVVLSDGEFHNRFASSEISNATQSGLRIFTLGFGTVEGGVIPDESQISGQFLNSKGNPIVSSLQEDPLRRIAALGNGTYFAGNNYSFIGQISRALNQMQADGVSEQSFTVYSHAYHWFLIPAMVLIIASMLIGTFWRISVPVLPLMMFSLLFTSANRSSAAISVNEVEQLLKEEKNEEASVLLSQLASESKGERARKFQFSLGHAQYRDENYDAAIRSFSDSLRSDEPDLREESHYNLGNSLYNNGASRLEKLETVPKVEDQLKLRGGVIQEWRGALDHYHSTIDLNRENTRARENYDYVKKKLDELEQQQKQQIEQQQQQQQGQPQQGGSGGSGERPDDNLTPEELERGREEERENAEGGSGDEEQPPQPDQGTEPEEADEGEEFELGTGEISEEEARRLLEENTDFEKGSLRTGRRIFERRPQKDW